MDATEFPAATATIDTSHGTCDLTVTDTCGRIVAAATFYTLAEAVDAALRVNTHRVTFAR